MYLLASQQCNGELPCSTCVKRKLQCSFTARPEANLSQRERNELEQLRKENDQLRMRLAKTSLESLETITTAPKDEALALFHQLRATGYAEAPVSNQHVFPGGGSLAVGCQYSSRRVCKLAGLLTDL